MLQRKLNNDGNFENKQKNAAMRRICEYGATCDEYDSALMGSIRHHWGLLDGERNAR